MAHGDYWHGINGITTTDAPWNSNVTDSLVYAESGTWYPPDLRRLGISMVEVGKEDNMRGLFEVIIVDGETGELQKVDGIIRSLVVAKEEASAKLKIVSKAALVKDVDDYDIIVRRLGDVRPKRQVQEVKLAKE